MIRDPSDGSVREKPEAGGMYGTANTTMNVLIEMQNSHIGIPVSGLRQPTRTDAQERLERSRQWLKQYHKPKDEAHAGGFSGEGTQDRDSGDDQGEAKR